MSRIPPFGQLESLIRRIEEAEQEIETSQRFLDLDGTELRRLLRESKKSLKQKRHVCRKMGIEVEELRDIDRTVTSVRRKIKRVEMEAHAPITLLRSIYVAIMCGEQKAKRAKIELVEANLRLVVAIATKLIGVCWAGAEQCA